MTDTDRRILKTRERVHHSAQTLLMSKGIGSVTHLGVAEHSGVGRKTIYRHWPTVNDLLLDVLAGASFPPTPDTGTVLTDLTQHLEALKAALEDGPLAYILNAINERAHTDPDMRALRDRLTDEGCSGIIVLLERAKSRGDLVLVGRVEEVAAELEGPLFYWALVKNKPIPDDLVTSIIDRFSDRYNPKKN